MPINPSLTVTSNTKLADLQRFAATMGDTDRLRGRDNGDGTFTLYARSSRPNLFDRLTGRSATTRHAAKEAVKLVFNNTERNLGGKTLHNVRHAVDHGISTKNSIRGQSLKELSSAADRHTPSMGDSSDLIRANRGPGLNKFPPAQRAALTEAVRQGLADGIAQSRAQNLENADVDNMIATTLGDAISDFMGKARTNPAMDRILTRLALSEGTALKYDLRKELATILPGMDSDAGRRMLDKALNAAQPALLGNKEHRDGDITINGERYGKGIKLGEGAFGVVHLYTSRTDPTKQVAVKVFVPDDDESSEKAAFKLSAFRNEANLHRSLVDAPPGEAGRTNVIGFEGAVRMKDGAIAIALECASKGHAAAAASKIDAALAGKHISVEQANAMKLTLLQDMARGLQFLQREGKDVVHYDFKNENVFIGAGGVAKVGDFGLSGKAKKFDSATNELPDNGQQIGPELGALRTRSKAAISAEGFKAETFGARFTGLTDAERTHLMRDANTGHNVAARQTGAIIDLKGVDTWSFGYAAFKMVYGREMANLGYMASDAQRVVDFGARPENRAIDISINDADGPDWSKRTDGAFAGSSGRPEIDKLLNALLSPEISSRPSMSEVLSYGAFREPGVGTDRTRQMLLLVLDGKTNELDAMKSLTTATNGQPSATPSTALPLPTGPTPSGPSTFAPATASIDQATVSASGVPSSDTDGYAADEVADNAGLATADPGQAIVPASATAGLARTEVAQSLTASLVEDLADAHFKSLKL